MMDSKHQLWKLLYAIALVLFATAIGCSSESYPLVPVEGQVTVDGEPIPDIVVRFSPLRQTDSVNSGPSSIGKTNVDGKFELRTSRKKVRGAVPGPHRVSFEISPEKEGSSPIPKSYQTGIEFTVPEDGTDSVHLDLQSN
ncbi:hypothetical protein [Calycomorphotria hydatis]|uniref:Carboxypeptidase regulatory-like domain-containing protein n=1 Tax=Calycomorphotria hydatis TaxID=2528027 RepID=A0A517T8I2_9PLAN|nr:hypothetical protein [Calycomorphotria hydatis]QDT64690.1 hypothetical protein V22_19310 [Calycomorphotria hydatis]